MADAAEIDLLALTAEIVATHVASNSVHIADVAKLIATVHNALAGLGAVIEPVSSEPEHKPAVSIRKSLASDEYIISLIDGKPYKTLRRHLLARGLTEAEYRARYRLPANYPMVARAYSAKRSAVARSLGFGRRAAKSGSEAAQPTEAKPEVEIVPAVAKATRRIKAAAKEVSDTAAQPVIKRGRKREEATGG